MEHLVDENNYPLFDGLVGLKQKPMINLLEWITENGYVYRTVNKTKVWYKPSQYPRIYLEHEQLIELYECTNL